MPNTIDISNISTDEFIEKMRELDRQSRCPCAGCADEECNHTSDRSSCDKYQRWVRKYVLNG